VVSTPNETASFLLLHTPFSRPADARATPARVSRCTSGTTSSTSRTTRRPSRRNSRGPPTPVQSESLGAPRRTPCPGIQCPRPGANTSVPGLLVLGLGLLLGREGGFDLLAAVVVVGARAQGTTLTVVRSNSTSELVSRAWVMAGNWRSNSSFNSRARMLPVRTSSSFQGRLCNTCE